MNNKKKIMRLVSIFALTITLLCALSLVSFAAEATATEDLAVAEHAAAEEASAASNAAGLGYIAAALSVGIAGVGSGIAVAAAAPAAIGALTEDEKTFGKSIVFVALSEGMALYGMLISILILSNL